MKIGRDGGWAFGCPSCPRFADAWCQERGMGGLLSMFKEPEDVQVGVWLREEATLLKCCLLWMKNCGWDVRRYVNALLLRCVYVQ